MLVPLEVLKGSGPVPKIALVTKRLNIGMCESHPTALEPGVANGDLFVVYSRDSGPNVTSNVYMEGVGEVVEPRVLSQLRGNDTTVSEGDSGKMLVGSGCSACSAFLAC